MWDVLEQFDATALSGAAGNAGAEWDGTSFYTTRGHQILFTNTVQMEQH